jgi:hypothetical protein
MSTLGQLKLGTDTKPKQLSAIQHRRNKLIHRLWEQIELAKSQIEGTQFTVKKYRSIVDRETGLKKQVEVAKRVREWWFKNETGKVCLSIKYGTSVLELAKGKPSIEVASPEDLIKALETIKQAVAVGELDQQIEQASQHLRAGFQH